MSKWETATADLFEWVNAWSPREVCTDRLVWLRCNGVPANIWNIEFFKLVGDAIGKYFTVDASTAFESRLDVARILISKTVRSFIDKSMSIDVCGEIFRVQVIEQTDADVLLMRVDNVLHDKQNNDLEIERYQFFNDK